VEVLTEDALEAGDIDQKELETEVHILLEQLNQSKPNMGAIKEYREKQKIYEARQAELSEVTSRCDEKKKVFEDLRAKRCRTTKIAILLVLTSFIFEDCASLWMDSV